MKFPEARILVFCRAPVPDQVKTRLIPVLSAAEAANLHERLSRRILDLCLDSELAEIELWCSPDISHPFFREYRDRGAVLFEQQGGDIGERMCYGAQCCEAREEVNKIVIIGTDLPCLDSDYMASALEKLDHHDVVIGPAEDGGYGLVGFRRAYPEIFENMVWSTDTVRKETCRRLDDIGVSWLLLPLLWDVDRPEDLVRLGDWDDWGRR